MGARVDSRPSRRAVPGDVFVIETRTGTCEGRKSVRACRAGVPRGALDRLRSQTAPRALLDRATRDRDRPVLEVAVEPTDEVARPVDAGTNAVLRKLGGPERGLEAVELVVAICDRPRVPATYARNSPRAGPTPLARDTTRIRSLGWSYARIGYDPCVTPFVREDPSPAAACRRPLGRWRVRLSPRPPAVPLQGLRAGPDRALGSPAGGPRSGGRRAGDLRADRAPGSTEQPRPRGTRPTAPARRVTRLVVHRGPARIQQAAGARSRRADLCRQHGPCRARKRAGDGARRRDRYRAPPTTHRGSARHTSRAPRRHKRRALRGHRTHRPELDRWPRHEPARCRVRPAAARSSAGTAR